MIIYDKTSIFLCLSALEHFAHMETSLLQWRSAKTRTTLRNYSGWLGRDLDRATLAVIRRLGFAVSSKDCSNTSSRFTTSKRYQGPILTWEDKMLKLNFSTNSVDMICSFIPKKNSSGSTGLGEGLNGSGHHHSLRIEICIRSTCMVRNTVVFYKKLLSCLV